MWVQSLGWEGLEEGMATHSGILAWRIPWTEELGRLPLIRAKRVRHDKWLSMHTHTDISFANMTVFFLPFQFFSFWLIALGRTSNTILNKSDESRHSSFVTHLKGSFSFSPLDMMLAISLPYMIIIMLRNVPSTPAVLELFYHKWMLKFLNAFSASIEIIIWFLFLIFLMCFTLTDLWILNHSWITGINSTWSLCAAAAAKLLQSCSTLCDPVDGSRPGSSVPGIL